jgi:hypothetical protein
MHHHHPQLFVKQRISPSSYAADAIHRPSGVRAAESGWLVASSRTSHPAGSRDMLDMS